ncbi:hypothetical protein BGZ46_009460 [Entomortierella lignicola]|nr:hypothetical protein BGZ46_009460 [Entomortierella lignicola]
MVQLRVLPESMCNNNSGFVSSNNNAMSEAIYDNRDNVEQHSTYQQLNPKYTRELRNAFAEMWFRYNFDSIISFYFDITQVQKYLPLSTKMSMLRFLNINGEQRFPPLDLENTILFIKQNQAAFPNKQPLIVNFYRSVHKSYTDEEGLDDALMDFTTYMAKHRDFRDKDFLYMRAAISIYEAVRKPSVMRVSRIPKFYEHAADIDLEGLREFDDMDMERSEQGEGPKREVFLRKCHNLRELSLAVDSHDVLSWAVNEATELGSSLAGRSLKKLEKLELITYHSYNSAIQVFNDAMVAFSNTLRSIRLLVIKGYVGNLTPIFLRNARVMTALQLHQRPSATMIGDWPYLLPRLKDILISLNCVASVKVGSFKQCPNLETLVLRYSCDNVNHCRPEGVAPSTLPETGVALDPRWEQAKMDCTLFPIWNLPKLKLLALSGMAAWRFNIKSLASMPSLESFTLEIVRRLFFEGDPDEHLSRQCIVSSAIVPMALDHNSRETNKMIDSELAIFKEQPRSRLSFFPVWHFPLLVRLELLDMASLKFDFRSLAAMQCLETLVLDVRQEALTRRQLEEYICHQYAIPSSQIYDETNHKPGPTYGIFGSDPTKAWVLPQLREITLNGPPSAIFFLDLLNSFPKLETISLSAVPDMSETIRRGIWRRNIFAPHKKVQVDNIDKASSLSRDDEVKRVSDEKPNMESRLKSFRLSGSWTITSQDTIRLLTVYAPFLENLSVNRVIYENSEDPISFFQVIKDADDINHAYAKTEVAKDDNSPELRTSMKSQRLLPGRNLRRVSFTCLAGKEVQEKSKLRILTVEDWFVFKYYGLRTYHVTAKAFVRQEDFDLVNKK